MTVALLRLRGSRLEVCVELVVTRGLGGGRETCEEDGGGIMKQEERGNRVGSGLRGDGVDEKTSVGVNPILELIGIIEGRVVRVVRPSR